MSLEGIDSFDAVHFLSELAVGLEDSRFVVARVVQDVHDVAVLLSVSFEEAGDGDVDLPVVLSR